MSSGVPPQSRSSLSSLAETRSVTAAETSLPAGDAGVDARELDQLLFALDGNAEGVVDVRVYRRYGQMSVGGGKTDVWVAGESVTDIGVHGHASTTSLSSAAVAINTLGADRVHLLVTKLTTLTTAYIHPYALRSLDGKPISLPYPLPEIAIVAGSEVKITDGTDDLAISSQGAALVVGDAAHDAADTGNPLKIGGKAATSEPSVVSAGDRVNAYFDANGYQMVKPLGNVAHDGVDTGAPIKVGGVYRATPAAVADGDRADLAVDAAGRPSVVGAGAHDGAAVGNPVRAGGVYRATPAGVSDGDLADLAVDAAGRQITVGPAAHDAATLGSPVKIGGVYRATPPAVSDGDVADVLVDAAGRVGTVPVGNVAHGAADAGNPIKVGATATASEVTVDEGDRANLSLDLSSRLRTIVQGLAAHDAAAAGNPVRAAGVYHSTPPTGTDGDVLDLLLDAGGRQITLPAGDAADDAADAGNPVKVGGKATATQPVLDANDRGNLSLTLGGRVRVDAEDDYYPAPAGLQSLAFTATSAQIGTALTAGVKYYLFATEHAHIRCGAAGGTAITTDSLLPKEVMLGFRPEAGETYIQAIRVSTDGTLYVWKGER